MKIGIVFGNPETTTGGNALKFYASLRLEVRRKTKIESGAGDQKQVEGNLVQVKVVKNKVAPPFREAEFDIMYNEGISKYGDILDTAVQYEVIKKSGAFYSYNDTKLGQGRENAKIFLKEHEELLSDISADVYQRIHTQS